MPPSKKSSVTHDDLAAAIADDLNKSGYETFFSDHSESPANIKSFLSTGASVLDLNIANRPHAGIPGGRITEFSGLEGSGKSLICAHIMKQAQVEGGVAILLDTENAYNEEFYHAIGLDTTKLIYRQPKTVEDIFGTIEKIVESYVTKSKGDQKCVIVVDSVTAAPTTKELEEGADEMGGYGTEKAKFLSLALRKLVLRIGDHKIFLVFTNQLRFNLKAQSFMDPYMTPGGKALDYYTSVRVRLQTSGQIKNKDKEVIGIHVLATVKKNRCGPPLRKATLDIYFDRGIDDFASWIKFLKDADIIEGASGKYTYTDSAGMEHKFQTNTWKQFVKEQPAVVAELYDKMATHVVTRYNSENVSVDDGSAEVDTVYEE